jgi:glycosyltransferase involved in cell wall biosynthesis
MSPHVLHVFPSFAPGGIQMRLATVLRGLPESWRHSVLALDGVYSALEAGAWPSNVTPVMDGMEGPALEVRGGLLKRTLYTRRFIEGTGANLVITNNWGSIEWALAARTLSNVGLIHTESGFGADEAFHLNPKRGLFRRFILPGAEAILLCSQTLVEIARETWRLPATKVHFVPDGIDLARFANPKTQPLDLPFAAAAEAPVVIGCVAPLRPEKNLTALLDAFHMASERNPGLALAIAGDGGERSALEAHARNLPCGDRIHFCGFLPEIERFLAAIDVCALSSDTEQLPNSILQAMCAGLPIAAFDVGDISRMVAPANTPFIVPRRDIAALSDAFLNLALKPKLRASLGAENAKKCAETYGESAMVKAYYRHMMHALGLEMMARS